MKFNPIHNHSIQFNLIKFNSIQFNQIQFNLQWSKPITHHIMLRKNQYTGCLATPAFSNTLCRPGQIISLEYGLGPLDLSVVVLSAPCTCLVSKWILCRRECRLVQKIAKNASCGNPCKVPLGLSTAHHSKPAEPNWLCKKSLLLDIQCQSLLFLYFEYVH